VAYSKTIPSGERFGMLTVIDRSHQDKRRLWWYACRCDCGKEISVRGYCLRDGKTKSCGCLRIEAGKKTAKHGHLREGNRSSEYITWMAIKERCYNQNSPRYKYYGARGITVCDRWLESFANFLADIGPRPFGLSIDRIDNSKGYSPENCRWATPVQQARNKRNSILISHGGESMHVNDWAEKVSIPANILVARLRRGWSVDRVLSQKPRDYPRQLCSPS
jgi:hypothetical protein